MNVWDPQTLKRVEGKSLSTLPPSTFKATCSLYGPKVFTGDDSGIAIWDARYLRKADDRPLRNHIADDIPSANVAHEVIIAIFFNPTSSEILVGHFGGHVRAWDVLTGKLLRKVGANGRFFIAFSPSGQRFAAVGSHIGIFDTQTGESIATLEPRETLPTPYRAAFSPDESKIVHTTAPNLLSLWDLSTSPPQAIRHQIQGEVTTNLHFSADGSLVLYGSDRELHVWDCRTGNDAVLEAPPTEGWIVCVASSRVGRFFASGTSEGVVRLWDAETLAALGPPLKGHLGLVTSIVFSPDERFLFSTSDDGTICRWDTEGRFQTGLTLTYNPGLLGSIAISHDGFRIACGSSGDVVQIWDTQSFLWEKDESLCAGGLIGPHKIPASVDEDGWLRTKEGGLLLWVPSEYRNAICDSSMLRFPERDVKRPIRVRWGSLCRGRNWTTVHIDR